jgi:two-component system sensor histidine kinase/response regulator
MATANGARIVVIDDDYAMRLSCGKILSKMGLQFEAFEDGARGLSAVGALKPDLVVVDLKMPGISGMEVVSRVREIDPQAVVVVITGYATIDTAVEAMKAGAYDFLPKPFSPDEFRLIVNRALERRQLALESQRGEVERALLKRRFVTFVSHQLQSPLAAIHQYLDVLKYLDNSEDAAAKRQEWIDRCLKRTEELQSIIRDWLTVAKIEGDTLSGQRTSVDLRDVISEVLKSYEEMAAAEQVSLEARLPEEPLWVWGDRNCLSMLMDNLITNAIKYNKPGGKVDVCGSLADGEVVVAVSDTGVGIPDEYRPLLFSEFFRVKGGNGKQTSGTGLGLYIVKKIVSEMGGTVGVESEVNVGSTFRVRLPAWHEQAEEGKE